MPPRKLPSPLTAANKLKSTPGDTDGGWATNALATDVQQLARTILAIEAKLDPITNPITPEATTRQLQDFVTDVHQLLHPNSALTHHSPDFTPVGQKPIDRDRTHDLGKPSHIDDHPDAPHPADYQAAKERVRTALFGPRTEPPARPVNQYGDEMALTEMCLELHAGNTQTYIDPDRKAELMAFIQWKLGHWEAPHHQSRWREFDDAIRALCDAAVRECDLTRVDGVG